MGNISGVVKLNIETYYAGKNQPTHPSIIAFDEPWNGYKYWMAYSPYPNSNGEEENPSIAVSNDLLFWDIPKNFLNPIAFNEEVGCYELKDPHILYRDDLDRIEIWYLGRLHPNIGGDGRTLTIFRKYSSDGRNWSNFERITNTNYLSPSVLWENGRYKLWEIGFEGSQNTRGTIVYRESVDAKQWSDYSLCSIDNNSDSIIIWHGAVSKVNNSYLFSYIETTIPCKRVCFAKSEDGINYEKLNETIELANNWNSFYRPYLLFSDNSFFCFYGVVDYDNNWYLSLSHGNLLNTLGGLNEKDINRMKPLHESPTIKKRFVKRLLDECTRYYRLRLLLLIIPVCIVLFVWKSMFATIPLFICVCVLCLLYLIQMRTSKHLSLLACIIMSILQGAIIFLISYAISCMI